MPPLDRGDMSFFSRWWRNIDHWTLGAIGILIGFGYILMLAATQAVADRIGAARDIFIFKQIIFLLIASTLILIVSMLSVRTVKLIGLIGTIIAIAATALTLVHGIEIKGARRWVSLGIISIQPSEFLKPCFAVTTAWLLSESSKQFSLRNFVILGIFALIFTLLKSQPDIGMLVIITCVLLIQFYINGLNMLWIWSGVGIMTGAFIAAVIMFSHVRLRIERFINPSSGDNYQVERALQAFGNGGLMGRGPGEGRIKNLLPDAHADFIFAVAGEEYGLITCTLVIMIFCFIIVRTLLKLLREDDSFIILASTGLITGFGLQAFVNMGSTLHLIPTKGMTLPLISYGGSSAISVALTLGLILALTRRKIINYSDPDIYEPLRRRI